MSVVPPTRPRPRRIHEYRPGLRLRVHDRMQNGYEYRLSQPYGDLSDHPEFTPRWTPPEMLAMGVFEGKYLTDCRSEFPKEWYTEATRRGTLSTDGRPHPELNYFGIQSRLSLKDWKQKGWILAPDVRGWFQWYCRFFLGRRLPIIDEIQIRRWRSFRRHEGAVRKACRTGDLSCRRRQRQALLQWAYDPFV